MVYASYLCYYALRSGYEILAKQNIPIEYMGRIISVWKAELFVFIVWWTKMERCLVWKFQVPVSIKQIEN